MTSLPTPQRRVSPRSLSARRLPLASAATQRETLEGLTLSHEFSDAIAATPMGSLAARSIEVLQLNVGRLCNQVCRHCHVDAGPDRVEVMARPVMEACLNALRRSEIPTVDITGGAPELNPDFRWFVREARALGRRVMDRCNLTILDTPSHADLPEFFAENGVEVVCSLPHYLPGPTDRQRGDGVFERSIRALRRLNEVGYGSGRSGLQLALVANPVGAFTLADQALLEVEFRDALRARHGVVFDKLYCITNMPISRYLEWLVESGNFERYMSELVQSFNPAAAEGVMCRTTLSVGWDGALYDCDFNQMLELPVVDSAPRTIFDFDFDALASRSITTARHCFGCTAGAGSSCGGSTA